MEGSMSISRTAGALGWRATTNWLYASSTDGKAETREDVGSTSVDRKEEEDDMESPLIGLSARWVLLTFWSLLRTSCLRIGLHFRTRSSSHAFSSPGRLPPAALHTPRQHRGRASHY